MSVWEQVYNIFSLAWSNAWDFVVNIYENVNILGFLQIAFVIGLVCRFIVFPLISRGFAFTFSEGSSTAADTVREIKYEHRQRIGFLQDKGDN